MSPIRGDQGWTIKLSRRFEKLVKSAAHKERRSIRVVIERALEDYLKIKREDQ